MLASPWVILGAVLFYLASVGGAYLKGHSAAVDQARAAYAGQLETAIAEANEQAKKDQAAALKVERAKAAAKVAEARRNVRIEKVIETNVAYRNVCIESIGMRELKAAIAGKADQDAASKPLDTLPAAARTR